MFKENSSISVALADLLERHLEEIAANWADKTYESASFRPGELWIEVLHDSTLQGLNALIETFRTGSKVALDDYLTRLIIGCLRSGFGSSEALESLLLCKVAVQSVLKRCSTDAEFLWSAVDALDTCFRWIVCRFNAHYTAEMHRCLRRQHEHIISMLEIGERATKIVDIDIVLQHVAEGVMEAAQVDHCDFYLVNEEQSRLTPHVGIGKSPLPAETVEHFMQQSLALDDDPFFRELLAHKESLVCENAKTDPRVNQSVVGPLGIKSVLAVPLVINQKVIAIAITGTFHEYRTFTEEQVELASIVARTAALIMENARLHEQSRYMAALEERERLAREIHDNLAQTLSILKLHASNIDQLIRCGKLEQAQMFLAEMIAMASEAHTDAREAISGLRSTASSGAELLPMLQNYLRSFRRTCDVEVNLTIPDEAAIELPDTAVIQLTRVIQEMLSNVRKHARARNAWIRLDRHEESLTVTVEDDGQGFDPVHVMNEHCGGVGLQIMRERTESLGGSLLVDAQQGKGTRIMARIPLPNGKRY